MKKILICLKNTSKKRSFNVDSLILFSFFFNLAMFWNFHLIIACFLFLRNLNCICSWVTLITTFYITVLILITFQWILKRSRKTRSQLVFILFYFMIEKDKLHLRSRHMHFTQWSDFASTQHFFLQITAMNTRTYD